MDIVCSICAFAGRTRIAHGLLALFAAGAVCAQQVPQAIDAATEIAAESALAESELDYDVRAARSGTAATGGPRFPAPRHEADASRLPTPSPLLLEGFALDTNLNLAEDPGPNPAYAKYHRSKRTEPSEDRVKLIQRILQVRGYLTGENAVDGDWGPKSEAALKRFQQEHGLKPDGKLGTWSLRALGLGPRHTPLPEGATLAEVLRKAKGIPAPSDAPSDDLDDLENASAVLADAASEEKPEGSLDLGSVPPDLARELAGDVPKDPLTIAAPEE